MQIIRAQWLLKPADAIVRKHLGRFPRPVQTMRPKLLATSCIHHQGDIISDRLASDLNQSLIEFSIPPAKRSPAHFDGAESPLSYRLQVPLQHFRFVKKNGTVGLNSVPVNPAKQAADRLPTYLAHEVPQGKVDSTDGMLDGPPTALPEGRLPERLRNPFRFNNAFPL